MKSTATQTRPTLPPFRPSSAHLRGSDGDSRVPLLFEQRLHIPYHPYVHYSIIRDTAHMPPSQHGLAHLIVLQAAANLVANPQQSNQTQPPQTSQEKNSKNPKTIRRRCFLALLLSLPQSQEISRPQKQPPRHISSKLAAWDVTKYLRLDWFVCRRSINTSPAWRNSTRHHQGCESSDPSFLHAYIHVHVPFSPPLGSFAGLGLMVILIY